MKRFIVGLTLLALPFLVVPVTTNAVDVFQDTCSNQQAEDSTVCKDSDIEKDGKQQNPIFGDQGVLTTIVNILTAVVAIIAVIMIILAGLKLVTSSTNSQEVGNAREKIIYAIVALAVAATAQGFVRFVVTRLSE